MLCVSISEGDYILIGDSIKVHFNKTRGKELILGVEAPRDVYIQRCHLESGVPDSPAAAATREAKETTERLRKEHGEIKRKYETIRKEKKASRTAAS